eukprot:ANDGO_07175.mRNA.1 Putative ankyrin repeat protein RF_0381
MYNRELIFWRELLAGRVDAVRKIVEDDSSLPRESIDEYDRTPLIIASGLGIPELVKDFLQLGSDPRSVDITGRSSLMEACRAGDATSAQLILRYFSDPCLVPESARDEAVLTPSLTEVRQFVNARDVVGRNALHFACENGSLSVARLLLNVGADPTAVSRGGFTALMLAAIHDDPELIRELARRGAEIEAAGPEGQNALSIACRCGNALTVEALAEMGADVNAKGAEDYTALMFACDSRSVASVMALIRSGADINARCSDGWSALISAVSYNAVDVVRLLLQSGAEPDFASSTDGSAICMAARFGFTECAKELVSVPIDLEMENDQQLTALLIAAKEGNAAMIRILVRAGANLGAEDPNTHLTALDFCVVSNNAEAVQILCEAGADISHTKCNGMSPLSYAASHGFKDLVSSLLLSPALKSNASSQSLSSAVVNFPFKKMPVLCALDNKHFDIAQLLVERGCSLLESTSESVLMQGCKAGHLGLVCAALGRGTDVNHVSAASGMTALLEASRLGHAEIVQQLLDANADVTVCEKTLGHNALMFACSAGHMAVARCLLSHPHMNVNFRSPVTGETALILTVRNGRVDFVTALVNSGADICIADFDGFDARYYARSDPALTSFFEMSMSTDNSIFSRFHDVRQVSAEDCIPDINCGFGIPQS